MPSMNVVARATVEGGLNTRRCITTRMNSVTQKTGRAHRSAPSARAMSREDAVPAMYAQGGVSEIARRAAVDRVGLSPRLVGK